MGTMLVTSWHILQQHADQPISVDSPSGGDLLRRVLDSGLPEAESEEERGANGIPFHPEVIEWFRDVCGELSLPYILT